MRFVMKENRQFCKGIIGKGPFDGIFPKIPL